MTTTNIIIPEYIYFSNPNSVSPSRVYHTANCNGRLNEATKVPTTEEALALVHNLGFTVCATCKLRYDKAQKAIEHVAFIEDYGIAALPLPEEFELRVYWHRGKGNPVEIWNSKTGVRR